MQGFKVVPTETWRKSSFSDHYGNCVEVRFMLGGREQVRDSKRPGGPVLMLSPGAMFRLAKACRLQ